MSSSQAPRIDGRLDDAAWRAVTPVEDFAQQRPVEGAAPTERTQVFVRYDDDALYIGARMFRNVPQDIARSVTRRDGQGNAERIQITFDTQRDRRTAYAFAVSAAGVRTDFHHSQDDENRGRENQYDPIWSADARVDSLGWTAEMRIPFSQFRFPVAEVQEWGFQLDRWMPDKNEDLQWIVIPSRENGYISRFGTLTGIKGIKAMRPTELLPYMAVDATKSAVSNAHNPFRNPTKARGGLDAKFGIASNLTVDATVNPDFGQVEADPAEVNLSAFETIVEERRTFFTEGQQLLRVEGPNYFLHGRMAPSFASMISAGLLNTGMCSSLCRRLPTASIIRILPIEYVYHFEATAMKTKLTVTIDRDLLPKAKRYARARGVSLSELIEAGLRRASGEADGPTFSSRWRGKFTARATDDDRYRALARKYL